MFLKNRNIIFKMKISKVTDYAALRSQVSSEQIGNSSRLWFIMLRYVLLNIVLIKDVSFSTMTKPVCNNVRNGCHQSGSKV